MSSSGGADGNRSGPCCPPRGSPLARAYCGSHTRSFSPAPAHALPAVPLLGLAALRPLAPPAGGDAALFISMGGDSVVKKLSVLVGVDDPMVDLTGPGATATAAEAAVDWQAVLDESGMQFTAPPADTAEAATRLFSVVRAVQRRRKGGDVRPLVSSANSATALSQCSPPT